MPKAAKLSPKEMHKTSQSQLFPVVFCFFALYISLIIFSPIILLMIVYRQILSIIFKVFYGGKYNLISSADAFFAVDRKFNLINITFFIYVKGSCDVEEIRRRLSDSLLTQDENGHRPYGALLQAIVEKFGFMCYQDTSATMDFENHVRVCPSIDDLNRTYTETEALDAIGECADNLWNESRPRWEILVVPKITRDDDPGEEYYAAAIKIHHVYVDGISFVQVLRNCLIDQPAPPLLFDPINPPIPVVPLYKKILIYLQVFFLGPYISLRLMGRPKDAIYGDGELTGEKFYGRLKLDVPLATMRRIRKSFNCSTAAILHSCFITALRKMTLKKGFTIPDEVLGSLSFGTFPYPDELPRNRAIFGIEPLQIGISDPMARLSSINESMNTLSRRQYALLASRLLTKIVGLYPKSVLIASVDSIKVPFSLSNVPGMKYICKLKGNDVPVLFGIPPLSTSLRFSIGTGYYGGSLCIGFALAKTKLISCREDANELIGEFENEVRYLEENAIP